MARKRTGADIGFPARLHPTEAEMLDDIAGTFRVSRNTALRWALRFAWDHQHTDDCQGPSPCAAAMYGVLSSTPPTEATGE